MVRRLFESGAIWPLFGITIILCIGLAITVTAALSEEENTAWPGCPPQNMLDGAQFGINFLYPATPEDLEWVDRAGFYFEDCDKTTDGINAPETTPRPNKGSDDPNAG